ncbi:MAG: XamI family restriction endonuclease [Pseudoflavonifractor sp.]|nr:XamI family restriction endonuclease [Pseudoflavonifractor sp.]
MLPVISQMKLGQLIGLNTTGDFEDKRAEKNTSLYMKLEKVAPLLCNLFNEYLDIQRFIWLSTQLDNDKKALAIEYSKNWTCSLISNQNSSTVSRNWRKELQETTATEQLIRAGYTSIPKRKLITSIEDLLPGQFTRECRVQGINVQKADIVVRLKKSKKLLLVEAKAIGVRIDAFKRIKECREKFNDWRQAFGRNGAVYGAFLSGFIPESECRSINDDGGMIFWEHKDDLFQYVNDN